MFFQLHAEEAELRQQGLTPEEIADAIADGDIPDRGEASLLDTLLGDEAAAARRFRLLEAEQADDNEDEDDDDLND